MSNPLTVVPQQIADLNAYHRNARTHSDAQLKLLADSIGTFGFTIPVLVDETNTILAGHGRVEAAKRLGMAEVPTIRVEHLTEAQKRAYILADNRIAEKAGWDKEVLALELGDLITIDSDMDVTITGFDMATIDVMLQPEPEAEDEVSDPLPGPVVSKLGDLWLLGQHRLLCGNALEDADYQRLMDGGQARIVFTDPPYNVRIGNNVSGRGKQQHDEFVMASGEMKPDEFKAFLGTSCALMAKHSVDGSIHYLCMDWRHADVLMAAAGEVYSELKNLCVWCKHNAGLGTLYRSQHELVFVYKHGTAPHINHVELGKHGRYRTNTWHYNGANMPGGPENLLALHPTVKPVAMIADALMDCSSPGDLVLDPFGGSGSTLMAAERVGRVARVLELDPAYVDVIIRRWQKRTGKQAVHAETGVVFDEVAGTEVTDGMA